MDKSLQPKTYLPPGHHSMRAGWQGTVPSRNAHGPYFDVMYHYCSDLRRN